MSKNLKPCPFCGSEAVVTRVHPWFMLKRLHYNYVAAGCKRCGAATRLFIVNKTGSPLMNEHYYEYAVQQATDAWNQRTD